MMKSTVLSLLILLSPSTPAFAAASTEDFQYILEIIGNMKNIIERDMDKASSQKSLSRITNATPLMKNDHYQGHQVVHNNKVTGFIGLDFHDNKATVAVFSTPPLRVRHATRTYTAWRSLLKKQFREESHNTFSLGSGIIAHLKKQVRKVSIDVYRQK